MDIISNFIDTLIKSIGSIYIASKDIYNILGTFLSIIVIHKAFYFVIGMFFTRKFKLAKKKHKYAICIAARNEKYVIGNLLDSISKQDYPKELLDNRIIYIKLYFLYIIVVGSRTFIWINRYCLNRINMRCFK